MHVLAGFVILIISIFMVINAGWNVLLIPLLMISFFAYVVLMDIFVWKKQRSSGEKKVRPEKSQEESEGNESSSAGEDSACSGEDSYSGDGGDFGGGGASGSW